MALAGGEKALETASDALFLAGKYDFSTHFQKPAAPDSSAVTQGLIFAGTMTFSDGNAFSIQGTDYQRWPWKTEPQNRRESERGTYRAEGRILRFESPEVRDGGWSFSGAFHCFAFGSKAEALKWIGTRTMQYHLLENGTSCLLLVSPHFLGTPPPASTGGGP